MSALTEQMSVLPEDKAFVPPLGKSYFASPIARSLDDLLSTPNSTPALTGPTSPGSSNEDVGFTPSDPWSKRVRT